MRRRCPSTFNPIPFAQMVEADIPPAVIGKEGRVPDLVKLKRKRADDLLHGFFLQLSYVHKAIFSIIH